MIKTKWNVEAVKAYETGQGVELVNEPYPHYVPLTTESEKQEQSEPKEWVGLTEEELIVIKGKTCPEIDWSARHGVPLNNGEQNAWLFTWFMDFAKETEAKLKDKNI